MSKTRCQNSIGVHTWLTMCLLCVRHVCVCVSCVRVRVRVARIYVAIHAIQLNQTRLTDAAIHAIQFTQQAP